MVDRSKIDFKAIAKQTGIQKGRIFRSKTFDLWVIAGGQANLTIFTPPLLNGKEPIRIVNNCWEWPK